MLLLALIAALLRANAARRREAEAAEAGRRELEAQLAALAQSNAELGGRLGSMSEWLGSRQADLARVMSERLDNVSARLGAGLESHAQTTGANLSKLNERLAVIDAAQARMVGMTEEVVSLKDILANKQTRGAFGQGRMEAIVRDGLPAGAYEFQATLSNKARPDCVIRLPGDSRVLAVDAKFPLEAFTLFNEARDDDARKAAIARVRADVGKHVKDIAERYLLPGETQDIALMFVPSESIYADLVEHFDDVVQTRPSRPRRHRLAVADDDGDPGGAGDPARPAHARPGPRHPRRGRQAAQRRAPARRAHGEAGEPFPPGAGGRRPDRDFRRKGHRAAPRASTRWSSARKRPRSRRSRTCGWRRRGVGARRRNLVPEMTAAHALTNIYKLCIHANVRMG